MRLYENGGSCIAYLVIQLLPYVLLAFALGVVVGWASVD
jgi:hypothetical protein